MERQRFLKFKHSLRNAASYEVSAVLEETVETSGGTLDAIGGLGIGADYKLGHGPLTFSPTYIVAIGLKNNDGFPVDFTLGQKGVF